MPTRRKPKKSVWDEVLPKTKCMGMINRRLGMIIPLGDMRALQCVDESLVDIVGERETCEENLNNIIEHCNLGEYFLGKLTPLQELEKAGMPESDFFTALKGVLDNNPEDLDWMLGIAEDKGKFVAAFKRHFGTAHSRLREVLKGTKYEITVYFDEIYKDVEKKKGPRIRITDASWRVWQYSVFDILVLLHVEGILPKDTKPRDLQFAVIDNTVSVNYAKNPKDAKFSFIIPLDFVKRWLHDVVPIKNDPFSPVPKDLMSYVEKEVRKLAFDAEKLKRLGMGREILIPIPKERRRA